MIPATRGSRPPYEPRRLSECDCLFIQPSSSIISCIHARVFDTAVNQLLVETVCVRRFSLLSVANTFLLQYVPRPAAGGGNQGGQQGGQQGGMRTRNKQTSSRQTQNGVSGFAAAAGANDKHSSGESENVPPTTAPTRNAMPPPPAPSDTAKRGPGGAGGGTGGGGAAVGENLTCM